MSFSGGRRFRFLILERYVAREFGKIFLLTLATLVTVYLIGAFTEKIGRLVQAEMDFLGIMQYLVMRVPEATGQILPAAVLLAVMITLGLLARHNETVAMRTSGINVFVLLRPLLLIAGVLSVILLIHNLYLIPWSQQQVAYLWDTRVEKKPPHSLINMERFWYKGDRAIFNILTFRKDTQTLEGVKIYVFDPQFHLRQLIAASRAEWEGGHWRFYRGLSQTFAPSGKILGESFQERVITLTEGPGDFAILEKKVTEMDVAELYRYIQRLERDGYDSTLYRIDLQKRLALSLTPLIVTLIGGSLALFREKSHIPTVIATGIGIVFVYWLSFGFCLSLGQAGRLPVLWAAWLPHMLFGLGVLIFLLKGDFFTNALSAFKH